MNLPNYTLRYSQKAKYLQLRISTKGLEVVVPGVKQISQSVIDRFLHEKKDWIIRHWKPIAVLPEILPVELPKSIELAAIQHIWEVDYIPLDKKKVRCMTNQSRQIKLLGDVEDKSRCLRLLREWLKDMAVVHLQEQLELLSMQHQLPFGKLTVRHTTTRWGSCSSNKDISLCWKLLFLPRRLMEHVLLHELCHTKVMSHGVRFWKLLEKLDPCSVDHKKELKRGDEYVPLWAK